MALVVSSFCALAALAAAQQRTDASAQVRTKVLPGNGYIRYQVEPGDDQEPPGELVVVHEERKPAPAPELAAREEPPPPPAQRARARSCADERGKLLARLFEMQGLDIDPDFARWLEHNRALGTRGTTNLFLASGEPLLQLAVKSDAIARTLAEDLARCEAAHRGR